MYTINICTKCVYVRKLADETSSFNRKVNRFRRNTVEHTRSTASSKGHSHDPHSIRMRRNIHTRADTETRVNSNLTYVRIHVR